MMSALHARVRRACFVFLALSIVCPPVAAADPLPVYGGPTFSSSAGGFIGFDPTGQKFGPSYVNSAGTAVASVWKFDSAGFNTDHQAVRWNASTAPAELRNVLGVGGINELGTVIPSDFPGRFTASATEVTLLEIGPQAYISLSLGGVRDINSSGTIVGSIPRTARDEFGSPLDLGFRAARWDSSGTAVTELGHLGVYDGRYGVEPPVGYTAVGAYAINDAGVAVGSAQKYDAIVGHQGSHAVKWNPSGVEAILLGNLGTAAGIPGTGVPEGHNQSLAFAINNSGTAVGFSHVYDEAGNEVRSMAPVRWDPSGNATALEDAPGLISSYITRSPAALNDAGTAVGAGYKQREDGILLGTRAVRWDPTTTSATELGNLGTNLGIAYSEALAVNNAGTAVGFARTPDQIYRAVYWGADTLAIDLNTLIDPDSGWVLNRAFNISDTGWIVGIGSFDSDGPGGEAQYYRHFLMQVPATVPEPGAGLLVLIAGLSLSQHARRRQRRHEAHITMTTLPPAARAAAVPLVLIGAFLVIGCGLGPNLARRISAKRMKMLVAALAATLFLLVAPVLSVRADIFEWEYINPAEPSQGKHQSTTLAPDGADAIAEPGSNLSNRNLTKGYLIGANLSSVYLCDFSGCYFTNHPANLSGANLTQADLSSSDLTLVNLTGANLTGAEVRGANFTESSLAAPQLYSTASYQAHDLNGINLGSINLAGANFSGFNLTDTQFAGADLTNANFSGANLTGAGISGTLTGMNLTGAEVRGARLWGVTKTQLYSTASYQANDLTGIVLYSDQTGWDFAGKNLSQATVQSVNLNNANFTGANLANAALSFVTLIDSDLSEANLTNALVDYANLTGARMTGAMVRGANFNAAPQYPGSGLTLAQLYSTSSYQSHDLSGMKLRYNVLTGADLAGQNLTNVDLAGASLEGANLTGANVRGTRFERDKALNVGGITAAQLQSTASYQQHDLSGIALGGNDLAGINLSGQNLTDANFEDGYGANLNGANLNQAVLTNAKLGATTLDSATLVGATLANLDLRFATLTNADFTEADLSASNFSGFLIVVPFEGYYHFPGVNLTGTKLSGANLTNANFAGTEDHVFGFPHPGANLTNADLSGADARGANFTYATLTGANTNNLIQSNGHIDGLDLSAGSALTVRDYDDGTAIVVDQLLTMDATGTLRLVFDADPWGSTISFAPGIPVALGGTLELTFAPEVDIAGQVGRTINLFDWTGITPTGAFNVISPFIWNLSNLYTTGEVTLTSVPGLLPGDFNADNIVDAADYVVWRKTDGTPDGYDTWRANFGRTAGIGAAGDALRAAAEPLSAAVPEPGAGLLVLFAGLSLSQHARRRQRHTRHTS